MRDLHRILETVYLRPWAIAPSRFQAIHTVLQNALEKKAFFDVPDDAPERKKYEIVGTTAIVPIEGTILNKCSGLEMMCGGFSLQTFKSTLAELAGKDDISSVVLSIDSGGGTAQGLPEAAESIRNLRKAKNVIAYTDSFAASAAYYLACQASRVFLSQSAEVGSLSVFCAYVDESAAYAKEGYKVELFKPDESIFKAMGYPGLSLTEEQRKELLAGVEKFFAAFKATVQSNRKKVSGDVFTARMYEGADAVSIGLADGVIDDINALVYYLNR